MISIDDWDNYRRQEHASSRYQWHSAVLCKRIPIRNVLSSLPASCRQDFHHATEALRSPFGDRMLSDLKMQYVGFISLVLKEDWPIRKEHPFLISDNRHYTFYINQRLLKRLPPSVLAVAFTCAQWLVLADMSHLNFVTSSILIVATLVTVIPTSLLEFRYYMIPFLLWRLFGKQGSMSGRRIVLESLAWIVLHVITIYIFLSRTFHWTSTTDLQRFMW